MTFLVTWIASRTGLGSLLSSLIAYAAIAALAGGALWGYGAWQYHEGKSAGATAERTAWIAQREEDKAKQLAKAAADQRRIDQIEAEYLAVQGQLAETQTALEQAIHAEGADKKPAMSRGVARAVNGVR